MKTTTKTNRLKEIETAACALLANKPGRLPYEFLALEKEFNASGGQRGGYVSLYTLAMPE